MPFGFAAFSIGSALWNLPRYSQSMVFFAFINSIDHAVVRAAFPAVLLVLLYRRPVAALFVPLSLAVGGAMITSYLLSSTFVPVLSVWLLENRHGTHGHGDGPEARPGFFVRMQNRFEGVVDWTVAHRRKVVLAYLLATGAVVVVVGRCGSSRLNGTFEGGMVLGALCVGMAQPAAANATASRPKAAVRRLTRRRPARTRRIGPAR